MKNLGYANGWSEDPAEVKEAREKGYEVTMKHTGTTTRYECKEGDWYYLVDSSD